MPQPCCWFLPPTSQPRSRVPTQEKLKQADRSTEWLLHNHDYAGVRYVDPAQITPPNAAALQPMCMFQAART